jgi:hypothetical protein
VGVLAPADDEFRPRREGHEYVASWVDLDFNTCWQIMKTDDRALLEAWCVAGRELIDFQIVPVRTSAEAAAVMASQHP